MKGKITKRGAPIEITFGEKTEEEKLSKIKNLTTTSKLGKQIGRRLYRSDNRVLMNATVKIEGGYSKSHAKKMQKRGVESDQYYYLAFGTDPDLNYTPRQLLDEIHDAMKDFYDQIKNTNKYDVQGEARINRIQIMYNIL